jgi:pimeloyl-ACP methyl ester carboxylesterase
LNAGRGRRFTTLEAGAARRAAHPGAAAVRAAIDEEHRMPVHSLGPGAGLYYEHTPPRDGGCTFVFFNALTGDAGMWQAHIVPALHKAGHGTLVYNLRGQPQSPCDPGVVLDPARITADAVSLLQALRPSRAVPVGLSIGGLFAIGAHLAGIPAVGLVLINTLRQDGPRLRWINDAVVRAVEVGGLPLLGDLYSPHLWSEEWLGQNRANFLGAGGYTPLPRESAHYNMLSHANDADWDLPYERIAVPVLVLTGLRDRVFYEPEVVARLTARMPQARRLDVPNGGHLLPAERPQAVAQALLDFAGGL